MTPFKFLNPLSRRTFIDNRIFLSGWLRLNSNNYGKSNSSLFVAGKPAAAIANLVEHNIFV